MKVTFSWTVYRPNTVAVGVVSAVIRMSPAHDEDHHVSYHQGATKNGLDGLCINGTWFEDLHGDDVFCSEMFAALTGKYPYEVREEIPVSVW